jgi:DNA-binding PadR family transcriptional regulator
MDRRSIVSRSCFKAKTMATKKQSSDSQDPRGFVPLKPDLFHILLALSEGELHGYGIMKLVEENTDGEITLEPSPLYRRLKRFLESGLVAECSRRPVQGSGDERRRYYRLTSFGRQVLAAEAARLVELVGNRRVRALAASAGRAG